ncbi:vacuolar protein sorting-associated protein [Rhizoctonia solani AG-3 Rhs1AP]|uniref:Vacuolar protein sorting-associated protein n=1 Tax=Rhizoctonia solani AG-3 Rhs1AP TaxID=1086054 RepID=X8JUW1_9AGAM|nr:vacuolar protein sorting-associated protein [Rhizoctonia solani AG-3 Rhs1AP]
MPTMTGEKSIKDSVELPPPVASGIIKRPRRLRNALALTAACGLFYLGTTSWNNNRPKEVSHVDPLLGVSDGIRHRHKNFGFDPRKAEGVFLSVPSSESAISVARVWTEKPHLAGTANDYYSSVQQLEVFRKHLGIKPTSRSLPVFDAGSKESRQAVLSIPNITEPTAWIDTYYPLLNLPDERKLEILNEDGTPFWSANVEEIPTEGDPAGQWYDNIGAWHGLSKGGDVQGKLVYAGYGRKQDFDAIAAAGHNLTGTIVLIRYGAVFRGLKVEAAQEAGAAGVLIYSDPRDNGAVTVENGYEYWPKGPALNPHSVQRGSVLFLSKYPGDPGTPGTPAYPNANRTEGTNIPSIPSLPISWANAQVLFKELESSDSVFSNRKIRLLNGVQNNVTPIWNTMAVIPGHIRDEVVILGNHRDAWVLGAGDPTSGTVSMHEITKGLGKLLKQGWKPLRTIVLASWDAEEYGLIGSTEWGEDFADWIQKHVVAYLNVDVATAGERFGLSGSPSLAHLLRQAAVDVPHPSDANRTLWDAKDDLGPFTGPVDKDAFAIQQEVELARKAASSTEVSPLGSGSDYTVFLQRLGIASSDESFGGTSQSAVYHYHSIWDSQTWMEKYGDPGFLRHVAIAKHLGLVLLRIADSIVLPLNTTQYAFELENYLNRVADLATELSDAPNFTELRHAISKVKEASQKLDDRKAHAEHRLKRALEKVIHREKQHVCGHRKFATARTWVKKVFGVHEEKTAYPQKWPEGARVTPRVGRLPAWAEEQREKTKGHRHKEHGNHHHKEHKGMHRLIRAVKEVQAVNKKLSTFEQGFLSEEGIKDREWYRHLGVAPGKWLGYGATTLPALTEAITIDKNATLATHEAKRLTYLLEKLAKSLD